MNVLMTGSVVFGLLLFSISQQTVAQVLEKPQIVSIDSLVASHGHGYASVKWQHQPNVVNFQVNYVDIRGRKYQKVVDGQNDEVVVDSIQPCMAYTFYMLAINTQGPSAKSDEQVYQAPSIPRPHLPIVLNSTETLDGYMIYWRSQVNDNVQSFTITSTDEFNSTIVNKAVFYKTEKLLALDPSKAYITRMTADNLCGHSADSEAVEMPKTDPPVKPRRLVIVKEDNQFTVKIDAGDQTAPIFEYLVSYQSPTDAQPTTLRTPIPEITLHENIEPCTNYTVSVVAVNRGGRSEPAITYATTKSNDIPSLPIIKDVRETDGMPTAYWTVQSVYPLIQQKIKYEAPNLGAFYEYVPGDKTHITLNRALRCQLYRVQVIAENKCGWSYWPRPFEHVVEPTENPAIITGLTKKVDGRVVTIQWPATAETEYILEFNVYVESGDGVAWSYWASASATDFVFPSLQAGKQYTISLQAMNPCGWSQPSENIVI